ncbi:SPV137 putative serine/threonine protein kinase DNA replication [Swinepox virus]|uniref:SPV137 putative serine/threonine protein kinase DNA replication n=1 Tax=Swinepox virus (strain Swine/Nebraska/17077-99/1999) TaxID=300880 RepID=Q8V3F9_SWPV1|nr:SPV137 putative serine/threonine protein kinase DNA replication [Swinepox virus]AAL69876.1 SPV137 putative serine/threonine protein kinase DNA replication [Swinepox virus]UED36595.1 SPV137 putative serine/threonine protein kinase DNA replication [Swinepox virus]UED36744.1 SPV137 putative serine/threonine protein kinase DNA replication [Swinepox virus]UUA44327.1 SPV137 [Swinepox virus]
MSGRGNMFNEGEILIDTKRRSWKLGTLIGKGGFGCIYTASIHGKEDVSETQYAIKIEPKSNGPLFVEQVFYQRIGKWDMIDSWKKSNGINHLGIPNFYGFGFYTKNKKEYRFIIVDRLGCDLNKIIQNNNNKLPQSTVFKIADRIITVLRYIHDHGYTHGDIKASNIAIDYYDKNKIYLIDYGLSHRYKVNDVHIQYKRDPKKMHNGTIEFTSIDMHNGASITRRGDLEILGYCMVKWLGGILPWENDLKNRKYVMEQKIRCIGDIHNFLTESLGRYPVELYNYFIYISSLKYDECPDYNLITRMINKT